MDPTIPLVIAAAAAVGAAIGDLLQTGSRDVLRRTARLEAALLAGCLAQLVVPFGYVLGAVVGAVLAFARFEEIVRARVAALDRRLGEAPDEVSSLLLLHDRIDALTCFGCGLGHVWASLAVLATFLFGVGLVGFGLGYGVWLGLLLGSLILFMPVSHGARLLVEFEEIRSLHTRLKAGERHRHLPDTGVEREPSPSPGLVLLGDRPESGR